jgi:hypothetical protein
MKSVMCGNIIFNEEKRRGDDERKERKLDERKIMSTMYI